MCKNVKISPSQHLGDQTYLEEHIKEIDESVKLGKTVSKWTIAIKYPVSQSKVTPKVSNIYVYFSLLEIAFFGKNISSRKLSFSTSQEISQVKIEAKVSNGFIVDNLVKFCKINLTILNLHRIITHFNAGVASLGRVDHYSR